MLTAAVAVVVVLTVEACGGESNLSEGSPVSKIKSNGADGLRPVPWRISDRPSGRRVRIVSETGYCVGTRKPRIEMAHVVERRTKSIITAMLKVFPPPRRPEICAGVELIVYKTVWLSHGVGSRELYDGSVRPPRQRWP